MSLANIQGKLSRDEMKKVMVGSGVHCLDNQLFTTETDCTCSHHLVCTPILNWPANVCSVEINYASELYILSES